MSFKHLICLAVPLVLAGSVGCTGSKSGSSASGGNGGGPAPSFTIAWSEYPSWSVFGVADEQGLIDGRAGELGEIELKWNVDIVLNLADYDTCIGQYGTNEADAVCITNMDILAPSASRPSVAILPTSTSAGADACIVVGINSIEELAGKPTYGLEKSVSQYCFERVLELKGKQPADFPFQNMDPAAAATAMQTSQADIQSIMVWNPFVMQTLSDRKDSKVLFDSTSIPEEIIDMVVVGKDSLAKPGGERFAYALLDTFYAVNALIDDPKTRDETLVALGAKFSKLGLEDMKKVVTQTQFYNTPAKGLELLAEGSKFRQETMPAVAKFLVSHEMAESTPTFGFSDAAAPLNFETRFLSGISSGIDPSSVK
jgi:ABC-type nitrate/sulfonate/bicarbonate transport system substrate-binding protein